MTAIFLRIVQKALKPTVSNSAMFVILAQAYAGPKTPVNYRVWKVMNWIRTDGHAMARGALVIQDSNTFAYKADVG
jgi:hypothetical protein